MVLRMQVLQALPGNVGVDGGRGNVSMAKQDLNRSQVGTMVEQMRSESMSQGMG